MVIMAVFACYLGFAMPDQLVNVFISVFALYLVLTGWLTVRRMPGTIGLPEKIALLVGVCLCAPFAILSFQLATGLPPLFKSAVPFKGPVLIAIYGFTSVLVIAAIGDAKVVWPGASRASRAFRAICGACASGSRWLPAPASPTDSRDSSRSISRTDGVLLPQFIPLGLLVFWMIRVRSRGWGRLALAVQER